MSRMILGLDRPSAAALAIEARLEARDPRGDARRSAAAIRVTMRATEIVDDRFAPSLAVLARRRVGAAARSTALDL